MSPPPTLTVEYRDDVAIIVIDDPDEPVNTLGHELAAELTDILDALEQRQSLRGVVLISGKPNGFVAGADLDMLRAVRREADASALSKLSQSLSQRISDIRVPTVAAIHGPCLGGGLELALAFDLRVATDSEATRLGLPEVQLGLLPGGGGTQRLPRLVGVLAALDLLLTGRQIRGRRAVQIGLVDALVEPDGLLERALALVSNGGGRAHRPASSWFNRAGLAHVLLTSNPIGRRWLFQRVRGQTLAKTKGCYPAPEQIIEVVRIGLAQGESSGLEAEAIAFGRLAVSPQSRQLVNLFFAANELKKDPGLEDTTVAPSELKRVGVLGGGLMGAGIAFIAAVRNELPVHIKDRDQRGVDGALARVQRLLDARVARGRMSADEKSAVLRRVTGSVDYAGFADLDIVIEAVFEELALKREMLQQVEAVGASSPIFASNTSAIPIADIAKLAEHPERVIGMHYFSPVEQMPLLEIVRGEATHPEVVATCVQFGKQQGKTVVVVGDGPGFYTSRTLAPYLNEAAWLLTEGVPIEHIDWALQRAGFPVGPIHLLDEIGIDVGEKVGRLLHEAFGDRLRVPDAMGRLIADGRLGRKSGRGFYRYHDKPRHGGKIVDSDVYPVLRVFPAAQIPPDQIAERCVLQMVNEAARCLEEGILRCPRDGDVAAIFGLGFPPFHGGPFRHVDTLGAAHVVDRLRHYATVLGARFEPAPSLVRQAESGEPFYPQDPSA